MKITHLFFAFSLVLTATCFSLTDRFGVPVFSVPGSNSPADYMLDGGHCQFLTVKNCYDEAIRLEVYCNTAGRRIDAATINPGETHRFWASQQEIYSFLTTKDATLNINKRYERKSSCVVDICLYSTTIVTITKDQCDLEIYPDKVVNLRRELI